MYTSQAKTLKEKGKNENGSTGKGKKQEKTKGRIFLAVVYAIVNSIDYINLQNPTYVFLLHITANIVVWVSRLCAVLQTL